MFMMLVSLFTGIDEDDLHNASGAAQSTINRARDLTLKQQRQLSTSKLSWDSFLYLNSLAAAILLFFFWLLFPG